MQALPPPPSADQKRFTKRSREGDVKENGSCKKAPEKKRNIAILDKWIGEHSFHPFPTKPEKLYLAEQAGVNLRLLDDWFANARRNLKLRRGNRAAPPVAFPLATPSFSWVREAG